MAKKKKVVKKTKKKVTKKLSKAQLNKAFEEMIDLPLLTSYIGSAKQFNQLMVYKSYVGEILGQPMSIEVIIHPGNVK